MLEWKTCQQIVYRLSFSFNFFSLFIHFRFEIEVVAAGDWLSYSVDSIKFDRPIPPPPPHSCFLVVKKI